LTTKEPKKQPELQELQFLTTKEPKKQPELQELQFLTKKSTSTIDLISISL
jgi:hypothetical protein